MKRKQPEDPCKKIRCKTLHIEGTAYRTTFTRKFENHKSWVKSDPGMVTAFIPGTIIRVLVKDGQAVKKGDELVVFEAMKMKNHVKSLVDGRVWKVHISEGQKIPKGAPMIEIR